MYLSSAGRPYPLRTSLTEIQLYLGHPARDMAALLSGAFQQSARLARDLLLPFPAPPAVDPLARELQARIEAARDETLEYHRTHRPANTARNYAPKQREWRDWCTAQGFPPGGQYLPGDWVDEGKLLLFIKEEVAPRAPRKGARLVEEKRKRRATVPDRPAKRRRGGSAVAVAAVASHLIEEGEDDEEQSDLVLMYNTVRGYVLAIKEL